MAILVVEHTFEPPLTEQTLKGAFDRLGPCLQAHGARWVRSYLSADGARMICEFEAADAEAIRASLRESQVPFDRVWTGQILA